MGNPPKLKTYPAHYPGVCTTCGGVYERNARITIMKGRAHEDCNAAPVFIKTAEAHGLTLWEFDEARTQGAPAHCRAYFVRIGRDGTARVDSVTLEDADFIAALRAGKLREAERGEHAGRAQWPQSCRVCDGVMDFGERLFYRNREGGPRQKSRHMLQCSPSDWRITKNAAGVFLEDLRPGRAGVIWHLPKRARTGFVKVKSVEQGTEQTYQREIARAESRLTGDHYVNTKALDEGVKFTSETVDEPKLPNEF